MEIRELIKNMVRDYFVILSCSFIATFVFCLVFDPDAVFALSYIPWMMVFALAGDLPSLILYSSKELTEKQWIIRMIVHFVVLEIILLVAAYFLELYKNLGEAVFFAGIIAAVYVLVRFMGWRINLKIADQINEKLKRLREK